MQSPDLLELSATENLAFDCQTTSLIIGQQDPFLAELLFENGVLGAKVLNDFLLLSIDPTGKKDQHQLPRLQNEFQRRLGSVDKSETIIGAKLNLKLRDHACEESNLGGVPVRTLAETSPTSSALRFG